MPFYPQRQPGSGGEGSGLTNELWRAALRVLFSTAAIYIAWVLIQRFVGPLLIILVLLGVIRLVLGFARRRDGW